MNRGYRLAAEVGGTKLQAALGTADGRVVARERRGTEPGEGAEAILHWLEDALEALLAKGAALGHRPEAVGIGFGGPVETASGTVVTSHQVPGWQGIPLRRQLEDRFGLPVTVANDANAAGWAEYCCGAGEGTSPFFYMNIGSGIGGALVLDGRLHDGQGRGAGEIGHTYIPDWTAAAGTAVRLEERCSGWAIERRIRAWTVSDPSCTWARLCGNDPRTLSCSLLAEAARQGDPDAVEELEWVAEALGVALANLIALVHPARIAVGGGVGLMGETLLDPVRRHVADKVFGPYGRRYEIVSCQLEEDVVLVGALLLAGAT